MNDDFIIFGPADVDLSYSPLRGIGAETYVLGAFNPGLTRLPNGNLLMMVRVAEALRAPVLDDRVRSIRWTQAGYVLDDFPRAEIDDRDPRALMLKSSGAAVLTSLSWLLPVELSADGASIVAVHADRIIAPSASYQAYGVEDPRISHIDGRWYMTTCSVSPERHGTSLYTSANALDWMLEGLILDHQNKDMLLFEGKVGSQFVALTRPLGGGYFAYPPHSDYRTGPCIQLATSPDALHWKPSERPCIRPRKASPATIKIGGGAPPILTPRGWLEFYHGVEPRGRVGVYRTFWAILDRDDPSHIVHLADQTPLLEAKPEMSRHLDARRYLSDIVFTSGVVEENDHYLLASGEDDLACRITRVSKRVFNS